MSSYIANEATVDRAWCLVDATGKTLGRLASAVASRLRGKHKPEFTPYLDTGDFVVVINVDKVHVTGRKAQKKIYYHHTGYIGGMKATSFENLNAEHPERVLELAVKGMLPKGPLGRAMFRKLKIYAGAQHPHEAQQPQSIDL